VRAAADALGLILGADPALLEVVLLTLVVSGSALVIACALGIPAGVLIGLSEIRGRRLVELALFTGMGLPPVVVGLSV